MPPTTATVVLAVTATATAILTSCALTGAQPPPIEPCESTSCYPATEALESLAQLPVAGHVSATGYSRDEFGASWTDDVSVPGGGNSCDTRNDILRRDLTDLTLEPGSDDCIVTSGTLVGAYTGATIEFTRGPDTSSAVQVDHVVALSDAWRTGAQQLTPTRRRDLANDPLNLQAVDGPTNQRKGDSNAASWLPPARSFRCEYVSRQIEVKAEYNLWVTQPEKDAMTNVLNQC